MTRNLRTVIVTFVAFALTVFQASAGREGWLADYQKGLAQAKAEKKLLLIEFSNGSAACQKQAAEVFAQQAFKDYAAKNLVLLEVDISKEKELPAAIVDQNRDLTSQYSVRVYPTLIVVNGDAAEPGRIVGYGNGGVDVVVAKIDGCRK